MINKIYEHTCRWFLTTKCDICGRYLKDDEYSAYGELRRYFTRESVCKQCEYKEDVELQRKYKGRKDFAWIRVGNI